MLAAEIYFWVPGAERTRLRPALLSKAHDVRGTMAAAAAEPLAPQSNFPDPSVDWHGSRHLCCAHQRQRQRDRVPQRTLQISVAAAEDRRDVRAPFVKRCTEEGSQTGLAEIFRQLHLGGKTPGRSHRDLDREGRRGESENER